MQIGAKVGLCCLYKNTIINKINNMKINYFSYSQYKPTFAPPV